MSGLYISCRRSDSAEAAKPIAARLAAEFGDDRVFLDDGQFAASTPLAIARSTEMDDLAARHLATACAMVLVVGPAWLAPDASGRSRLHQPDDYVRLEVEWAIERAIPILPVFVSGATGLPSIDILPDSLHPLAGGAGVLIREDRFEIDMIGICAQLSRPLKAHAEGPTADDLLHPALGFTPITLASGVSLGAFEALRLQTTYQQVKQSLSRTQSAGGSARQARACRDAFASVTDGNRFQLAPDIAPALDRAARQACRIKPYKTILAAVDLSFLRWGRSGLAVTDCGLYHFGDRDQTLFLPNSTLAKGSVRRLGDHQIGIGDAIIAVPSRMDGSRVYSFVQAAMHLARQVSAEAVSS